MYIQLSLIFIDFFSRCGYYTRTRPNLQDWFSDLLSYKTQRELKSKLRKGRNIHDSF